jgi:hypothetical protein
VEKQDNNGLRRGVTDADTEKGLSDRSRYKLNAITH